MSGSRYLGDSVFGRACSLVPVAGQKHQRDVNAADYHGTHQASMDNGRMGGVMGGGVGGAGVEECPGPRRRKFAKMGLGDTTPSLRCGGSGVPAAAMAVHIKSCQKTRCHGECALPRLAALSVTDNVSMEAVESANALGSFGGGKPLAQGFGACARGEVSLIIRGLPLSAPAIKLVLPSGSKVQDAKLAVERKASIPRQSYYLMHRGRMQKDHDILTDGTCLMVGRPLAGCGFASGMK